MNVTGVGVTSSLVVQSLGDMRSQLADLQQQLGTGLKSTTYAGLGIDRGLAVGLRSKLASITGPDMMHCSCLRVYRSGGPGLDMWAGEARSCYGRWSLLVVARSSE